MTTNPARLTAERLEEIRNMELPKGRAVIAMADLLDEVEALRAELELLARIRLHPHRDTLVQALDFECDAWRSVQDDGDPDVSGELFDDLLMLLRGDHVRAELAEARGDQRGREAEPPAPGSRDALRAGVRDMIVSCRSRAQGLRTEVDRGISIRQSAESKMARVQVLESTADQLERLLGCAP